MNPSNDKKWRLEDRRDMAEDEYDEPGVAIGAELPGVGFVSVASVVFGCEEAKALGGQMEIAERIVNALNASESATRAPHVDGQDFYELCQAYRHSKEIAPHPKIPNTVQAFNNLREYVKTGKLPWPSYEKADPEEKKCRDCGVRWTAPVPYCPECLGLPIGTPADSSRYVGQSKP